MNSGRPEPVEGQEPEAGCSGYDAGMSPRVAPPLLDESWGAFIQDAVAIIAASRSSDGVPVVARACGCRVSGGRQRVTVLVSRSRGAALVAAVGSSGTVAVVFSKPSTHVTIQLKAAGARIAPARASEVRLLDRYVGAFGDEVEPLGHSREMVRNLLWCDAADLCTITFSPQAIFLQTPGPRAGELLAGGPAAC